MGGSDDTRREHAWGGLPRPAVLAGLLAVLAAAVPAALGLAGRTESASLWGLLTSGVVACGSSAGLLAWWFNGRRDGAVDLWRAVFGVALALWGIGQLLLFGDAAAGRLSYPATGDLVGAIGAPLSVVALLCVPRSSTSAWPGLRLALDAVTVGLASAATVRMLLLTWPGGRAVANDASTALFLVADTSVLAFVVLAAVRDVRSRLGAAVCGVACHVVADVIGFYAVADGVRNLPWVSASLWCIGWPLVALGVLRYRPRRPGVDPGGDQDRREAIAAQVATILSGLFLAGTLVSFRSLIVEPGNMILMGATGCAIAARDLIAAATRVQLTAGLRAQAFRDSLTGLPNRRALTSTIACIDGEGAWVVLTLDLDGFKRVNDVLGHHAGDDLLVAVAEALRGQCPPDGLVARVGGDEFAVLAPGDLDDGAQLAERLRCAVKTALERHAPGLDVSVSVGVGRLVHARQAASAGGAARKDRLTALVESGAALRAAKAAGRDRVEVYDAAIAAARRRGILLEQRLRRAVATGAVQSYGQPVVDLSDGSLRGFEALARWTDEELGVVPPMEFIEVAERTGLVVTLGEQLIEVTLTGARGAGVFEAGLSVAINVSPIQLRVPGFAEVVRHHLKRHDVPPHLVTIEVTEAILVADDDPAVRTLQELADLGVGIAIDDFGTGYSALGYLRRLPVDILKVDRSLTTSLDEARTLAIVEAVVGMARRMGIRIVLEGIEDEPVARACNRLGADLGQGWLYGRPMPWDQAAAMVAAASAVTPAVTPTTR